MGIFLGWYKESVSVFFQPESVRQTNLNVLHLARDIHVYLKNSNHTDFLVFGWIEEKSKNGLPRLISLQIYHFPKVHASQILRGMFFTA